MVLQDVHINKFKNEVVLVAVSGGVDSMVLCDLMLKEKIAIEIAHVNYSLRGKESDKDLEFVLRYANEKKIPCHTITIDSSEFQESNIQEKARIIRYDFFKNLMLKKGLTYLATAHHLNDKIEGSIINFFRGTDINGLISIRDQPTIVRPLLKYYKDQIIEYANINRLEYREDKTNKGLKYTRNFIRNKVLPDLNSVFPNVEKRVIKTIQNLTEKEQFIKSYFNAEREKVVHRTAFRFTIIKKDISEQIMPSFYLYNLIKDFGFSKDQCNNIIDSILTKGKEFWTNTNILVIGDDDLVIEKLPIVLINQVVVDNLSTDQTISLNDRIAVKIGIGKTLPIHEKYVIDLEKVSMPVTIRAWGYGDYIRSAKMKGRKKALKSLFNDHKIDKLKKNYIPVIVDNENEVICVVGYAVNYRLASSTDTVNHIWFTIG